MMTNNDRSQSVITFTQNIALQSVVEAAANVSLALC